VVADRRPRVQVIDLGTGDGAVLQRLYDDVLMPSFAPSELVPAPTLRDTLATQPDALHVAVAVEEDGSVIGGAVADWDPGSSVFLLSYMAVRADRRGLGIGNLLMDRVRSWWEARDAAVALAEVEDPRHHEPSEHGDPVARLRFYEREGARVVALPYIQPEVRPGAGRVSGMLLITFHIAPQARVGDGLSSEVLRSFLRDYLVDAEGITPAAADADLDALYPGLRSTAVPILDMDRFSDIGN
jgi:GNAT superfamily N-acetyltransferase